MTQSLQALRDALFLALIAASAVTDWRERRIYNALTYPAIISGLVLALAAGPASFGSAAAGAALAAAIMYPLCRSGGMGLGDLKLLAAVGALQGAGTGAAALVDSALVGGVFAVGLTLRRGTFVATMRRAIAVPAGLVSSLAGKRGRPFGPAKASDTIPYGVAVGVGSFAAWYSGWPW